MNALDINPEVLEQTAKIIESYCQNQKNIMRDYLRKISSLSSEWTDDVTLGSLIREITQLEKSVNDIMNEILESYPNFFRKKAEQIRNRPKL